MRFQKYPDSCGQRPKSHHISVASHNVDTYKPIRIKENISNRPNRARESTHERAKSRFVNPDWLKRATLITLKANWFVALTIKQWK